MEITDCPPVRDREKWSRTSKNFGHFSEGKAEIMELNKPKRFVQLVLLPPSDELHAPSLDVFDTFPKERLNYFAISAPAKRYKNVGKPVYSAKLFR